MPEDVKQIENSAIIMRRIPPPLSQNTKSTPDGALRPTSQFLQKRDKKDSGISFTQLSITSPQSLLQQLDSQNIDRSGWGVCCLLVGDVRKLGLEVVHKPEGDDPGHCEIQGDIKRKTPKKLAEKALMLSDADILNGTVPDRT